MLINERPGVYSSIEIANPLRGTRANKVVGITAVAENGEKGVCTRITSFGEAVSLYGADSSLTRLIRLMFLNGAFAIEATPAAVGADAELGDYIAAFKVLMEKESVTIMTCDSTLQAVHIAMREAIEDGSENTKHRIGIVEGSECINAALDQAQAINHERIVMVYPGIEGGNGAFAAVGLVAAAFAGVLAQGGDPALPLNGVELLGLDGFFRVFSDAEITKLVRAGITPIESSGGRNSIVRGITTRTKTAGELDNTWRELTTVLVIDHVVTSVRSALRLRFPRAKNTAQTRGAIRTQVIIELQNKLKQEIIAEYGEVSAASDPSDPTVCIVNFEFTVAHGLNRIRLMASISV